MCPCFVHMSVLESPSWGLYKGSTRLITFLVSLLLNQLSLLYLPLAKVDPIVLKVLVLIFYFPFLDASRAHYFVAIDQEKVFDMCKLLAAKH